MHTFCLRLVLLLLLVGGLTTSASAQDRIEDSPGYVDLSLIEDWFDATPSIEVNIKGALLRLVAEASRYEDPDLADLLFKLQAIQMRGFPMRHSEFEDVDRATDTLVGQLEDDGWDTVMRIRDRDERVDMYLRMHDDIVAGLIVMVVEPGADETVFVNIVGDIDPEQIGRLGRKFNFGRRFDDW